MAAHQGIAGGGEVSINQIDADLYIEDGFLCVRVRVYSEDYNQVSAGESSIRLSEIAAAIEREKGRE